MTCEVAVNIRASAAIVWSLLTDAKGFSRWNSTVTRIDGEIREGEQRYAHLCSYATQHELDRLRDGGTFLGGDVCVHQKHAAGFPSDF